MSTIISPKPSSVKSGARAQVLDEKSAKLGAQLETELISKLIAIYEKINVVFFGTPEFAVPILKELINSDFKPSAVITSGDKPVGRNQEITHPPVKILAQKYEIPVFQPTTKEELVKKVTELKPDLIIVTAFGTILPKAIIDLPKYGSINVHPSLLPKHRGPSPIQFSILNGDQTTGVSIMLMNEKIDEGPILTQEKINIEKDDTSQILQNKLSVLGGRLLIKTLSYWIILKEMPRSAQYLIYPQPQDNSKATYTKILTKSDGKIFWNKTAQELERQIRAFYPWPGSFTYFKS
ncbi:MAG: methionyl-tRNA formyltransferase, partial [Candidatus Portnoybacteria bacterium RBG_13_41_18]